MPDTIDLGRRVVPGSYFLHRTQRPPRTPFDSTHWVARGAHDSSYRHCLTYSGGGSTIGRSVVELIDSARRKVFVGTLFLGDSAVRQALERAVHRLHGGVYVLAALDNKGIDKALNETAEDMDLDRQTEYRNFKTLTETGIYVRGLPGLHAKFVVVDDTVALVSSANLVTRSFESVGENGVVISNADDVRQLSRLFKRLWAASPWDMPPNPRRVITGRNPSQTDPLEGQESNGVIWTWKDQWLILDAIRDIIHSAREELILATWSIGGMSQPMGDTPAAPELLFDPVAQAVERGVRVRMLLRGRNLSDAARIEAAAFAALGVEVHADDLTHAKAAIADGCRGALFSANFMSKLGLTGGVEVGVRIDGTSALAEAVRYFEHCLAEASLELATDPTASDIADRLYFVESMRPWPFARRLAVQADDDVWETLAQVGGPLLFEHRDDGPVQLIGQNTIWLCSVTAGGSLSISSHNTRSPAAAELLRRWLTPKGGGGKDSAVKHGICSATLTRVI